MKKNTIKFCIFDTETTGVDSKDRILEGAYSLYEFINGKLIFKKYTEEKIMPSVEINPSAASVHGIWYPDLIDSKKFEESKFGNEFKDMICDDSVYFVAHNAPFDTAMLEKEGLFINPLRVIDTLKIARLVNLKNEDIKSNGLQYMRYYYNFDMDESFQSLVKNDYNIEKLQPHTALSDVAVLAFYLLKIFNEGMVKDVDEAVRITMQPTPEEDIKFGNVFENGTSFEFIAANKYEQYGKKKDGISYLNWAINNMENLSADVRIGMARGVIKAMSNGSLSYDNKDALPMKAIAAAFDKSSHEYLYKMGYDVDRVAVKVHDTISTKITAIESEGMIDESKEYPILQLLLKYYSYIWKTEV